MRLLTTQELDALPDGTILRGINGDLAVKGRDVL
jgi:hypothetical protein